MNFQRFVHIDSIIEKVYRDYEISVTRDDAKEWAYETMGKIGVPSFYKDANAIIEVINYKGVLPPDFVSVDNVRTFKDKIVLLETMYEYMPDYAGYSLYNKTLDDGVNNITVISETYNNYEQPSSTQTGALVGADTSSTTSSEPIKMKWVYKIDGDYIKTGFKDNTIEMAYKAIPMFNDYSPMIPDDERVKSAITMTLAHKVATREWFKGNLDFNRKNAIEAEYLFTVGSARNRGIEPTTEEWELLKDRSMAIIKSTKSHETAWSLYGNRYLGFPDKQI